MSEETVKKSEVKPESLGELFPKAPPGYRLATPQESLDLLKAGMVVQNSQQTLRRCDAEIRAAEAEAAQARNDLAEGRALVKKIHEKLGIEGEPNDILTLPTGAVAILVDKEKRDEAIQEIKESRKGPRPTKVSEGAPKAAEPPKEEKK